MEKNNKSNLIVDKKRKQAPKNTKKSHEVEAEIFFINRKPKKNEEG